METRTEFHDQLNIFTVTPEHLGRLSAGEAVAFIADLLWGESMRIGLPTSHVRISTRINVKDGGIDATINPTNVVTFTDSFLPPGCSGFQIKSGRSFTLTKSQLREELFGGTPPSRTALGESVRACMDTGGRYILVCTGTDPTTPERKRAKGYLEAAFTQCGYDDPQIDLWGQSELIGFLKRFPSLALSVTGHGNAVFQTHASWSEQGEMRRSFKAGERQQKFVADIQEQLRRHDSAAVHVRVRGEAGIGKTRLVLEATRAEDLKPLVVYCDSPEQFLAGPLLNELLRDDNVFHVVAVVDECDLGSRTRIWNQVGSRGKRIRFVSIYNDIDEPSGTTVVLDAPPLEEAETSAVIRDYDVPKDKAEHWAAHFCDGSPRVAHLVGQNLRSNPDSILKSPDTVDIWERYIAGPDDLKGDAVQRRRTVLRYLALFKRFGYAGHVVDEARAICTLIHEHDTSITWGQFQEIVKLLRDRKILQGETTLYITPKLLHIKLWSDWFEHYGVGFDIREFEARLTPTLVVWFHEMFRYAKESREAMIVVRKLLNESGPFGDADFFHHRRGAEFFLHLTDATPDDALRRLEKTVGTWDLEQLRRFSEGRRQVVWALEKIAVWKHLFDGASRLLLRLAEAENESIANNATGVFVGLFSPGRGDVAPTEASPEERFPVLLDAMNSPSKEQRRVALRAADHGLETNHFSRFVGPEHQGLRQPPQLWMPKTWGELFDAYRRVWQLIDQQLDALPDDARAEAVRILLRHARGVGAIANLTPMVTSTLSSLLHKPYVDRRDLLDVVENVYRHDASGFEPEVRVHWDALLAELTPQDSHSRLERYVGMDRWADSIDENGKRSEKLNHVINDLAREAYADPEPLRRELSWLVTEEAKNGFEFGYALGRLDATNTLVDDLLTAQRNAETRATAFFLGGYLRALSERSPLECEQVLDRLAADETLMRFVPELSWRSGLTDQGGRRVLALAKAGAFDPALFGMFSYGGVIRNLSDSVFHAWIDYLLKLSTPMSVGIAVDLCYFNYVMGDAPLQLPRDMTLELVTAEPFFGSSEQSVRSVIREHSWNGVATALVEQYPEIALDVGRKLLAHFGEEHSVMAGFNPAAVTVLYRVLRDHPHELWAEIVKHIGPPIDSRAYRLTHWLREGALSSIPAELVWEWIDEDVETRARYVASFMPPSFPGDANAVSVRDLLVRYGTRSDVRNGLVANFFSEFWTGRASRHYETKLSQVQDLKAIETNKDVLRWLTEYEESIARQIGQAKIREERDDF